VEAAVEESFIFLTGSEPGAARLGLADTATICGPVH